jgi:hypothetical protein
MWATRGRVRERGPSIQREARLWRWVMAAAACPSLEGCRVAKHGGYSTETLALKREIADLARRASETMAMIE